MTLVCVLEIQRRYLGSSRKNFLTMIFMRLLSSVRFLHYEEYHHHLCPSKDKNFSRVEWVN